MAYSSQAARAVHANAVNVALARMAVTARNHQNPQAVVAKTLQLLI